MARGRQETPGGLRQRHAGGRKRQVASGRGARSGGDAGGLGQRRSQPGTPGGVRAGAPAVVRAGALVAVRGPVGSGAGRSRSGGCGFSGGGAGVPAAVRGVWPRGRVIWRRGRAGVPATVPGVRAALVRRGSSVGGPSGLRRLGGSRPLALRCSPCALVLRTGPAPRCGDHRPALPGSCAARSCATRPAPLGRPPVERCPPSEVVAGRRSRRGAVRRGEGRRPPGSRGRRCGVHPLSGTDRSAPGCPEVSGSGPVVGPGSAVAVVGQHLAEQPHQLLPLLGRQRRE
ncbi:hypothetical protein LV78_000421 [Actinosynnema pretiosum]|nr:hypothetical protein [Actinosynnema pretiosum]